MSNLLVLIDDNPQMLAHYEDILRADRSIVVAGKATDGRQGLEMIRKNEPDMILLDMVMPRMDGLGLLQALREFPPEIRRPEVMVVSAVGQEAMVEQAFALGASFYLMKPFEDKVLLEQIGRILGTGSRPSQIVSDISPVYHTSYPTATLEEEVSETLLALGVPAHIRGYQYLRDAIIIAVRNKEVLNLVTKVLYPAVASMNNTTPGRVERSMRHAVELSWAKGDRASISEIFGHPAGDRLGKPTNSEFIALIADRIRIREQHR